MDSSASNPKQQAHDLIDRMEPGQVSAVISLLQAILDPAARRHVSESCKGEPAGEEETLAIVRAWLYNRGVPDEQVLAEFDLKAEDFKHSGHTAHEARTPDR
jgi:hypothetical protein